MWQQGQVFELTTRGPAGERLWAFRYRASGRDSKRVQRGGFGSEEDARAALERALEMVRRRNGVGRRPTLAEFVEEYLAQHEVSPVTLAKAALPARPRGASVRRLLPRTSSTRWRSRPGG